MLYSNAMLARRSCLFCAMLALLTWHGTVFGQSDADRAAARQLGYQGVEAYQAGDFETAERHLSRAFDVVPVPTLGLWLGRALTKNGKLVEAAEAYREVGRIEVKQGKVAAQKQAQKEALAELEQLEARIPSANIDIAGAPREAVRVAVDDTPLPNALLGVARPMNPGTHRITAQHASQVIEQTLELSEGAEERLTLTFEQTPDPSAAPPAPAPASVVPADAEPAPSSQGSATRTAGWVALGVGAAGLVAGGVTGVMVLGKRSELADNPSCRDNACEPEAHGDVDSYNKLRTVSAAAFVIGGVGAALGATLLLTAGSESETPTEVVAYVGIGSVGLSGRF